MVYKLLICLTLLQTEQKVAQLYVLYASKCPLEIAPFGMLLSLKYSIIFLY